MKFLSSEEAQRWIRTSLLTSGDDTTDDLSDVILAEYLRSTLCLLTSRLGGPVYVTALVSSARRQLRAVWPWLDNPREKRPSAAEQLAEGDLQPDTIRRVLDALHDLRDVVHLGAGYWLPAPTRYVAITVADALIVSGLPTIALQDHLGHPVRRAGIGRAVALKDLPADLKGDLRRWQDRDSWLARPSGTIAEWTEEKLHEAQRTLSPSGSSVVDFQVYMPSLAVSRPQAFRWLPVKELRRQPDGLVLCRAYEGWLSSMRRYWLGTLRQSHGEWRADKEANVEFDTIRRLQYGIDYLSGALTTVEVASARGSFVITLRSMLPAEERRLLIAFGRDESQRQGKLPARIRVGASDYAAIQQALTDLGIAIIRRDAGA